MPMNRVPFGDVVEAVREHTSNLLGTTISYSDDDWAAPTALTGWTRSHVATHLVEGALGLVRVIEGLHSGNVRRMYESEAAKHRAIELGALDDGLELQIKLDTSASALQSLLPGLDGDDSPVTLRAGYRIAARQIPLARLSEVVLHHIDLGSHFSASHLTPEIATALLAFQVELIGRRDDYPPLRLVSNEGYEGSVGRDGAASTFHGPAADLWAWLARGIESGDIYRADSPTS